jgi:hypothetical protein
MSLVKEKSDIELKKKREDLIKYINAIDAEMTLRKKNKSIKEKTKGSFIDSLLSKKPEKSEKPKKPECKGKRKVTPRSTEIRATKKQLQDILTKNGVEFKSSEKKADLIAKVREKRLIIKAETKNKTEKKINTNIIRATVAEMKKLLRSKGIEFKSTAKKAELSQIIRDNKLIREVEYMSMRKE